MRIILFFTLFLCISHITFSQNQKSELNNLDNLDITAADFFQIEKSMFQCSECIKDLELSHSEVRMKYAPNLPDEDHNDVEEAFIEWRNNYPKEFTDYSSFLREHSLKALKINKKSK